MRRTGTLNTQDGVQTTNTGRRTQAALRAPPSCAAAQRHPSGLRSESGAPRNALHRNLHSGPRKWQLRFPPPLLGYHVIAMVMNTDKSEAAVGLVRVLEIISCFETGNFRATRLIDQEGTFTIQLNPMGHRHPCHQSHIRSPREPPAKQATHGGVHRVTTGPSRDHLDHARSRQGLEWSWPRAKVAPCR